MGVAKKSSDTVNLVPDQLHMEQDPDMHMFRIKSWNLGYNNDRAGLSLQIVMSRKVTSELMTTYFPSFLLLAITFSTTFFKPFFFEAALSVNLTTMLVMTTIFIRKMESLPPTSDIKMIDIWLVFCQLVPFVEVVLLTAMEYHREDTEWTTENDIMVLHLPIDEDATEENRFWDRLISARKVPDLKTLGK